MEKDIDKRDENMEAEINRVDKALNKQLAAQKKQFEIELNKIKRHVEMFEIETGNTLSQIKMRLSKVDDSAVIKDFVEAAIKESEFSIKRLIQSTEEDLSFKIESAVKDNLTIPKLIGDGWTYPHISKFIKRTHKVLENLPDITQSLQEKLMEGQREMETCIHTEVREVKQETTQLLAKEIQLSGK